MPITVLTIDDDPGITELLAVILKVHNFDVLTANSGEIGVQLIKQKSPSVVILDMMMPDMDGWQVCKAVRDFSNVPVLILSALDDPTIVASVLDSGADDYLTKPVTSAVLVAHINKLIRRTGALHEKTTGGLTMRTSTS